MQVSGFDVFGAGGHVNLDVEGGYLFGHHGVGLVLSGGGGPFVPIEPSGDAVGSGKVLFGPAYVNASGMHAAFGYYRSILDGDGKNGIMLRFGRTPSKYIRTTIELAFVTEFSRATPIIFSFNVGFNLPNVLSGL